MNGKAERHGWGLVVGGGIAGPVVAMALQRAGIPSTIYEANPATSNGVGSFLTVASNGLDALQAIDAHRPVAAAGVRTHRMVISSGSGKVLGEVDAGIPLTDGSTTTTIERARLHRALHDEARGRGISIVHGKQLVGVEETEDGVVALFDDGTREEGGFLVGADGIWSSVRTLIDPQAPRPEYTGLIGVGAVARGVDLPPDPSSFQMTFGAPSSDSSPWKGAMRCGSPTSRCARSQSAPRSPRSRRRSGSAGCWSCSPRTPSPPAS